MINGFFACVIVVILWKKPPPAHYNIVIGLAGFALMAFMEIFVIVIFKFHYHLPVVVGAWTLYTIGFAFICLVEEVYLVATMALFVSSNVQSFAESLRQSASRAGAITALVTAGLVFKHLVLVCSLLVVLMLILIGIIIFRWRQLRNPTQIIM